MGDVFHAIASFRRQCREDGQVVQTGSTCHRVLRRSDMFFIDVPGLARQFRNDAASKPTHVQLAPPRTIASEKLTLNPDCKHVWHEPSRQDLDNRLPDHDVHCLPECWSGVRRLLANELDDNPGREHGGVMQFGFGYVFSHETFGGNLHTHRHDAVCNDRVEDGNQSRKVWRLGSHPRQCLWEDDEGNNEVDPHPREEAAER
mmetsp:Transcript_93721/g.286762  ORF Transcript_93721/g.286762 Transcript_93721/m.286762 type:complete len:202 (+) Transcript_93721:276-881(+)